MTAGKRILIIDGDDLVRRTLTDQLGTIYPELTVEEAATGATGVERAERIGHDLILLDARLPDRDGREVCRALRKAGCTAAIIMMTATDSDDDAITGLDASADDYVVKPFRIAALLARIHAFMNQQAQTESETFAIGPYRFRPSMKMLIASSDRNIRLTEKETAILSFLCRIGNQTVSRETLLDEVWGYNAGVTTHTLETHVYRLRQKMEDDPQAARILLTEPGGYRLNM